VFGNGSDGTLQDVAIAMDHLPMLGRGVDEDAGPHVPICQGTALRVSRWSGLASYQPKRKYRGVETASKFAYARAQDGAYIAYRTDGEGALDVVWQPDWTGNIDMEWQSPLVGPWLRALSRFARVITHDHRGVGLSSRNVPLPTLEERVSDLVTVLRATAARRPVLVGVLASGAVNVLLAATRPTLPRAFVWLEPMARYGWAADYPWGITEDEREAERDFIGVWGTQAWGKAHWEDNEAAGNPMPPEMISHMAIQSRNACTPDVAERLNEMWYDIDVRGVLGAVQTPTMLMFHRDRERSVEEAEHIASLMPAAEVRAMPGAAWTIEEMAAWAGEIREFVGIQRPHATFETVLSTVLFTDIVGATERQTALGNREWHGVVQQHHAIVRGALKRWHGVENDTAGDGFYATFDGPAERSAAPWISPNAYAISGSRYGPGSIQANASSSTGS
jgi:pimeloyl-ACP methyl ester carboxylesterase